MLPFDELNVLAMNRKLRSIEIERFFDEMDLPEREKSDRKEFARNLEKEIFIAFSLIHMAIQYKTDTDSARDYLEQVFLSEIKKYTVPDSYLIEYAERISREIVDSTIRNKRDVFESDNPGSGAYFFSEDRARNISENETNSVFNYEQYRDAKSSGMRYKKWITMKDERVRTSHSEVDGIIVPIDDVFIVGGVEMRFPHDPDAPPEETVNCRCTLHYSKN